MWFFEEVFKIVRVKADEFEDFFKFGVECVVVDIFDFKC